MKEQIGLWIDHRHAVIVSISDAGEKIIKVNSDIEKHTHFKAGKNPEGNSKEDVRDRTFENHLKAYYNKVIALIRGAEFIHIFGPGEAKGELEKQLEQAGLKEIILTVETADKMTDRQIAAKVLSQIPA